MPDTTTSLAGGELEKPDDAAHPPRDHGWGTIREDRVQFSDLRVRRAAEFVETCGIADELEAMLAKATGRPRLCTVQGLLVGMTLCSRRNGNGAVFFNQVTDILHWAIPEDWRHRFELPERPDNITGLEAAYAVVLRLFRSIVVALDPSPLPKNKRLTLKQVKAHFAGADPDLLGCGDTTPLLPSLATPTTTRGPCQAAAATLKPFRHSPWASSSTSPGTAPVATALPSSKTSGAAGTPPETSPPTPPTTTPSPRTGRYPCASSATDPTYDYRIDQLEKIDSIHGASLIEGNWYCPSMPADLVNATIDHRRNPNDPKAIDQETWRARIDARTRFALAPKGKPNDNGRQRYMCPATAGRVQCPLKPGSRGTNPSLREVDPIPSPVGPPKIREQTSISVNVEDGTKHWQPLAYGSPEWQEIYGQLRNTVEGMNGYTKTDAHEGIEHGGNRRVRGIAAQTLLLAFQLAHANERKINAWLATLPGPDGKPHRRARHKTRKPRGTWTPTGHITPPAA